MAKPPLLILGMHRSGTSLLTRLLEELGLFVGAIKDQNEEAQFFLALNSWIFRQANVTWDNTYNFQFIGDELTDIIVTALDQFLKGPDRISFLGADKAALYADIRNLDISWGWKDPRNTFTASIWKRMFPDARVIHIYRNPMDVAASLRDREIQGRVAMRERLLQEGMAQLLGKNTQFQLSARVETIKEGIKLWEEYVEQALSLHNAFDSNFLQIRYEDLLEDPIRIISEAAVFAGLTPAREQVSRAASSIDASKQYGFLKSRELTTLYRRWPKRELFAKLGYEHVYG